MAMFGPNRQVAFNELFGMQAGQRRGMFGPDVMRNIMRGQTALRDAMMGRGQTTSTAAVGSPGQTQVIRPSQQQPARRAAAPQAGASSSLITEAPSPAEVALATTSLLGG